jgi:hypothetical protein
VSNNFSSLCYSCREYQTAANRFVTSHFVEQITSRMRSGRFRRTESTVKAKPRQLVYLVEELGADLRGNGYAPANTATSLGRLIIPLRVPVSESLASTNCLHEDRAGRRDLLIATPCSVIPRRNNR